MKDPDFAKNRRFFSRQPAYVAMQWPNGYTRKRGSGGFVMCLRVPKWACILAFCPFHFAIKRALIVETQADL